jgi:hypothetical protein
MTPEQILDKSVKMTKEQILKLRPEFKLFEGGWLLHDWFEISEGVGYSCIKSGLRHADGETKSPYHYEECIGGKNAKKSVLENFSRWWDSLNKTE